MTYSIPEQMPSRRDFLTELLQAVFPETEVKTWRKYPVECEKAANETGIIVRGCPDADSNLFRLMFELGESRKSIFKEEPVLIAYKEYKEYYGTIATYFDTGDGAFKSWFAREGKSVRRGFDAALFFSYLLFTREECAASRRPFFEKCLGYVGISDIEDAVACKLFRVDWSELGGQDKLKGVEFTRLANRAIILLGTAVMTVFELLGTYTKEKDHEKLERLHTMFARAFKGDISALEAMQRAELAVFKCNKFFVPRSINTAKPRYPQEFFVLPEFKCGGRKAVPFSEIKNASKSRRLLIAAKTGLGKSLFIQMATLCMLGRCAERDANMPPLLEIANQLDVPQDMFVMSVPARMFSFCYMDERYKAWTGDFVSLFFNCMWKLSGSFNFYSGHGSQLFIDDRELPQAEGDTVTQELIDYVRELARTGRLLLILDSFDEISSGRMRTAYLNALTAFYNQYCCYPEAGESGAHVIILSREMSPQTMATLENALVIEPQSSKYEICPLNAEQREKLILNWNRSSGTPDEKTREMFEQIESNHYYKDYSVNPYMLSVVCVYFGDDLGRITQRLITTLVNRMINNNRPTDLVIHEVLANIVEILQSIAWETVANGRAHFSRRRLDNCLRDAIDETGLTEDEIGAYIERLHEIFVTEVGLIVPADGADNDYQFINSQIRYELAAKGIRHTLEKRGGREIVLPPIKSVEEYVGMLVPLLCNIDLEDLGLAERLAADLAMHDFKTDTEEAILVRAMLDLLLNRYGGNIATTTIPGGDVEAGYVRRAQRILLMRLLTSKSFCPTDTEKKELADCAAFKGNAEWFSAHAALLMR